MPRKIAVGKKHVAIVDDDDYDRLSKLRWHTSIQRSTTRRVNRVTPRTCIRMTDQDGVGWFRSESMHRIVMNAKPNQLVDHIDGDHLNNQKSNLRFATNQENARNQRAVRTYKGRPPTSRFKGVHLKRFKKIGRWYEYWEAGIYDGGTRTHLGHFKDEIQAACVYDDACRARHGQFARPNFPHWDETFASAIQPSYVAETKQ
jgi:hypothetical protein